MNAEQFRDIFYVLHNIDKADLEAAGVITIGANGGSDWNRFNSDIGTFVIKLRQENLEALWRLVQSRLPVKMARKVVGELIRSIERGTAPLSVLEDARDLIVDLSSVPSCIEADIQFELNSALEFGDTARAERMQRLMDHMKARRL
jgi:hypothetical protein